ncbi:MAG TPA: non-homologous end-joining DNA ligase, partial [Thermoanaerobaculia bacterium]
QVRFTEWTNDGKLRHPTFLGLRFDKAPMEAIVEKPVKPTSVSKRKNPERGTRNPERLTLTNPDRLLYPRDKITKQDVADYYEAMSGVMRKTLDGRPLALEHWNQGIDKPSWFQQDIGREAPPWMTLAETPTRTRANKTVRHLVADSPEALRWLAQHSVLTIHMWSSRMQSLENPDWVVFDLDPDPKAGFLQAVDTALVLRDLFEQLEIPSVPKTSGKKGIHLFVPLAKGHTHEEATDFACKIGEAVSARLPYATVERTIAKRKGRLYLDCMQNGYGKTMVAPYSLRAADGAPVSAPLQWSEVTRKLDPSRFSLPTMPDRIGKLGDLFAPVLKQGIKIPKLR